MKKLVSAIILSAMTLGATACSTDIHYDSISTEMVIDIAKITNLNEPVTLHHRFQFDRDLVPLASMSLVQAWMDAPITDSIYDAPQPANPGYGPYDLETVHSVGISLVEENTNTTFWLYARPDAYSRENALFSEMSVYDLRDYMNSNMLLEIEINIVLDSYHAMRYWRDVCKMQDECKLTIPLSMQFKMED